MGEDGGCGSQDARGVADAPPRKKRGRAIQKKIQKGYGKKIQKKCAGVLTTALCLFIFCSAQVCRNSKKGGIYELVCCQMLDRICILGQKGNGL